MAAGVVTSIYRRLGGRYPFAFVAVELHSALFIVAGTLALFTFYFDGSTGEYLTVLAIALSLTEVAIVAAIVRLRPQLAQLRAWISGERDPESTQRAWATAVSMPLYLIKKDMPLPILVSVLPTCVAGTIILDLEWYVAFPLLAVAAIALGYSATLH
jgi:hypothetical protein